VNRAAAIAFMPSIIRRHVNLTGPHQPHGGR
jgi:hypothetical protein